ncbi:hypothetical protein [Nocardia cyriacigeorgica]|uniref:hypothetical protein n=1 Tax=Nocardia cyriacigeorgica TaxID=135487 RepID=UPI00245744C8|nr:hypothetical protein [Nocardia cyriacigeorgica]
MSWVEVYEQAAERAQTRRLVGALDDPPPGIDADTWHRLCEAIDASGWLSGRSLAPRDIREIAHAAVVVLCPPTSENRAPRPNATRPGLLIPHAENQ